MRFMQYWRLWLAVIAFSAIPLIAQAKPVPPERDQSDRERREEAVRPEGEAQMDRIASDLRQLRETLRKLNQRLDELEASGPNAQRRQGGPMLPRRRTRGPAVGAKVKPRTCPQERESNRNQWATAQ